MRYVFIGKAMIIITSEKTISTTWILEYLSLQDLDALDPHETIIARHVSGVHLLCFCVSTLQEIKRNHEKAVLITNNYAQRRNMIAQQLAAGGNPS